MHSNFNDLKTKTMTAKEFLDDKYNGKGYEAKIHDWGNNIHGNVSLTGLLEEYHRAKLKLLGIADVIERFSIGQPVKWEGMKFWVSEDNGDSKVLVCNCEDTKDIQQSEYNDWWVDRDVLNAL